MRSAFLPDDGDLVQQLVSIGDGALEFVELVLEVRQGSVLLSQSIHLLVAVVDLGLQRGNLGNLNLEFTLLLLRSGQACSQVLIFLLNSLQVLLAVLRCHHQDIDLVRLSREGAVFASALGEVVTQRFVLGLHIDDVDLLGLSIGELLLQGFIAGLAHVQVDLNVVHLLRGKLGISLIFLLKNQDLVLLLLERNLVGLQLGLQLGNLIDVLLFIPVVLGLLIKLGS